METQAVEVGCIIKHERFRENSIFMHFEVFEFNSTILRFYLLCCLIKKLHSWGLHKYFQITTIKKFVCRFGLDSWQIKKIKHSPDLALKKCALECNSILGCVNKNIASCLTEAIIPCSALARPCQFGVLQYKTDIKELKWVQQKVSCLFLGRTSCPGRSGWGSGACSGWRRSCVEGS